MLIMIAISLYLDIIVLVKYLYYGARLWNYKARPQPPFGTCNKERGSLFRFTSEEDVVRVFNGGTMIFLSVVIGYISFP